MPSETLEQFVADCLSTLDEKTHGDLIRRRYGLQGVPEESLEVIGASADGGRITRAGAHLRQLAALKILARLFSKRAAQLVSGYVDLIWDKATDGAMFKKATHVQVPMPPAYLLAWHVTTGKARKAEEWLELHASSYDACWIDNRIQGFKDDVQRIKAAAEPLVQVMDKPWPVRAVSAQLDCTPERLRPLLTAAFPKHAWNIYQGYVFSGSKTARPRRAADLHAVMKHEVPASVSDLRTLCQTYRAFVPQDPCSERDLLIVARQNKHLFLEVGSGYLSAIGMTSEHRDAQQLSEASDLTAKSESPKDETAGDATVSAKIAQLLTQEGPLRLGTILQKLDLPKGTITGTIGQDFRFVRVLPGTYALDTQVASIDLEGRAESLFNEDEVLRIYIRARGAGEPFELFPLWGWTFEYQLALWAKRHASTQLPALLHVIQPEEWSAPAPVKADWLRQKAAAKTLETGTAPGFKLGKKMPDARELLAALLLANDRRQSSVVSCNLVMAADGLDSSVGCSLLMLLVATGCVDCGPSWLAPHPLGEMAQRWAERLSEDLANHGRLDWSSASAQVFLAAAKSGLRSGRECWFSDDALARVVGSIESTIKGPTASPAALITPIADSSVSDAISVAPAPPLPATAGVDIAKTIADEIVTTEQLRIDARANNPEAMYQLAIRTRDGNGTQPNPTMAKYWLKLAALRGHSRAKLELDASPLATGPTG